jgi:hypothetical protein
MTAILYSSDGDVDHRIGMRKLLVLFQRAMGTKISIQEISSRAQDFPSIRFLTQRMTHPPRFYIQGINLNT